MKRFLLLALLALSFPALADVPLFGPPPVIAALEKGDIAALRAALMAGGNPNLAYAAGKTPLILAAIAGRGDMVKMLLEHRADANGADTGGMSAMHYAATGPDPHIIDLLTKAGARVDITNREGVTPLMMASKEGRLDNVRHLLSAGADRERLDFTGRSAVDWARDGRNQSVMRLLAEAD